MSSELYLNILPLVYYGWKLLKFIMSKIGLRPKVSSTKVTGWVDPSFDDFSENTSISTITTDSSGVNNSSHRRKNVTSVLESSRFPTRKKIKLSPLEEFHGLENSNGWMSENEPWVDKYKPESQVLNTKPI
ncbi:PREDICTED: cell cycle checkpoint protein RAD17-like isoform X2 [Dipodomys ordii]|uniref:Cell cycle checkpoint protein RAD17-like isoform X2 n=1 Tax=Dipodomys ordii TaxID=10020 RepID=A0A1S3F3Y2_DIPOR|nr:PREDICTED: cell cycle checkpoint protein RAD17-like isoform X2 [Dipodomys ordii]